MLFMAAGVVACGMHLLPYCVLAASGSFRPENKTKTKQNPDEPTRSVLLVFSSLACATESVASYRNNAACLPGRAAATRARRRRPPRRPPAERGCALAMKLVIIKSEEGAAGRRGRGDACLRSCERHRHRTEADDAPVYPSIASYRRRGPEPDRPSARRHVKHRGERSFPVCHVLGKTAKIRPAALSIPAAAPRHACGDRPKTWAKGWRAEPRSSLPNSP